MICEDRLQLFPIKHKDMYDHYKGQVAMFWTVEEAIFTAQDRADYDGLSNDEKHFINHVLAFFASSD